MDVLTLILRTVRTTIEASGVPPDGLQAALEAAESRLRASLGGEQHHISRAVSTKERIATLLEQGLTPQQVSQRLGVTDRYVRMVSAMLRP